MSAVKAGDVVSSDIFDENGNFKYSIYAYVIKSPDESGEIVFRAATDEEVAKYLASLSKLD